MRTTRFTCEECGATFEAVNNGRNRFCSEPCRTAWRCRNVRYEKTCEQCGARFQAKEKRYRLCSRKCAHAWNRAQRPPTLTACEWCGIKFQPTHHHGGKGPKKAQRACSVFCSKALKATRTSSPLSFCEGCGNLIPGRKSKRRRYCAPKCRLGAYVPRGVGEMRKWTCRHCRGTFLKPKPSGRQPSVCDDCRSAQRRLRPRTPKIKGGVVTNVFSRDNWTCHLCGGEIPRLPPSESCNPLYGEIDHVTPRRHGGTDDPENLRASHRACNGNKSDRIEVESGSTMLITCPACGPWAYAPAFDMVAGCRCGRHVIGGDEGGCLVGDIDFDVMHAKSAEITKLMRSLSKRRESKYKREALVA